MLDEYCPWKSALDDLPPAASQKLLYVLFGDSTGSGYRVQAVAVHAQSFESRKALPEPWRGMRDEQLDEITGICGGVFCHASGFILGAKSRDAALALARKACDF